MTVAELIVHLSTAHPDALVLYRGTLDVMVPLEAAGVRIVERAYYEDQDDRPDDMRGWFDQDTLTDRLRKVERTETATAVVLRREGLVR